MDNTNHKALALLEKYRNGTCTAEELALLTKWYAAIGQDIDQLHPDQFASDIQEIKTRLRQDIQTPALKIKRLRKAWGIAASLAVALGVGYYFIHRSPARLSVSDDNGFAAVDTFSTGNAFLVTDQGDSINLLSIHYDTPVELNGLSITRSQSGELSYAAETGKPVAYTSIRTPHAGQYRFTLPDGSKVWMNAGSEIKFPINFDARERRVVLQGEAYFEITTCYFTDHQNGKRSKIPFHVTTMDQELEVLGTHFNISAYATDKKTTTTLLEGAVSVHPTADPTAASVLKPNQQSVIQRDQAGISIKNIVADQAIDWKNGYYLFEQEKLSNIVHKISRWYDVDIELAPTAADIEFGGKISKKENLDKVIEILEATDNIKIVSQQIDGRRKIIIKHLQH